MISPVEKIVGWIKNKPVWWRHAIRLSLRDSELMPTTLQEVYRIAKMEHGLLDKDTSYANAEIDIDTTGFGAESGEVTLKSISKVINVGALAEDQFLEFPKKGLTVVYGDNGAGKSAYARILKHACLARGGAPEILGNVFELSTDPSSAIISIEMDGKTKDKNWNLKSAADTNLKSIRVFDGEVADNFVSDEDELGYKPLGLHLLEDLALAIDYVKRQVVEETMPGNGIVRLPDFGDTKAGGFIGKLSSESDVNDVDKHTVNEEEIESLGKLQRDINELKSKSPEQIKKELNNRKSQLLPLQKFITDLSKKLGDKAFDEIKSKSLDVATKTELAKQLRYRILNDLPVSNIGGTDWYVMWSAAEKFFSAKGGKEFPPKNGEDCPLCLQEVGEESANKLKEFQEFVLDKTSQQAKESQDMLNNIHDKIKRYNLDVSPYEAAINIANDSEKSFADEFNELLSGLKERQKLFCQQSLPEALESLNLVVIEKINSLIEQTEKYLIELADDKEAAKILKKKETKLAEILDRKLIKANIEQIKSNILRYKALKKYGELESQCKTRPVTDINTDICKSEVINPIVEYFDDELVRIGFNRFKVVTQTRGRSGAQLLRLEISNCGEPLVAKIASEGEQRCIAIACFLAEMRADHRKSAVIFDDPVNSLSHQWSGRVAKRLVEESLHRQVVVLTHDIAFYKYLLEEIEGHDGATFNGICLERSRKRVGIVRSSPPWDALTTRERIKELNIQLQELRRIDKDGTERDFRVAAYNYYGYLREAWERLVEEKLLNQVVTRFGRSVQTTRLKRLSDLTEDDFKRIDVGMSKCSTYFRGHDSAPVVGDPFPTIQDVEADLTAMDDFNKELNKRRN